MNKPILGVERKVFRFENGVVVRARGRHNPILDQIVRNADIARTMNILEIGDPFLQVRRASPSGRRHQAVSIGPPWNSKRICSASLPSRTSGSKE